MKPNVQSKALTTEIQRNRDFSSIPPHPELVEGCRMRHSKKFKSRKLITQMKLIDNVSFVGVSFMKPNVQSKALTTEIQRNRDFSSIPPHPEFVEGCIRQHSTNSKAGN